MWSLSSQTFADAMMLCSKNSCYKVCVVFDDRSAMTEFLDELREAGNIPNVRRAITRRTDYGRLEFFNGSMIEIIPGTENNICGKRCNQLITSGVFDREFLACMERMVCLYRRNVLVDELPFNPDLIGMPHTNRTNWVLSEDTSLAESFDDGSEELDTFLDSFIIDQKCE